MCALRANQEITVIFDGNCNIIAGLHQARRNRRFLIDIVQTQSNFNILVVRSIHGRTLKYGHKIFFCIMNNGNLSIGQRQPSGHRGSIHITEIGRNIIAEMTSSIGNMQNILHDTIGYGVICFIFYSDNIKRTQNRIVRKPKLKVITGRRIFFCRRYSADQFSITHISFSLSLEITFEIVDKYQIAFKR